MAYTSQPWTMQEEPKAIKAKRKEVQLKEIAKKNVESMPVAVSRIVKFLNKNKEQTFTNAQIASAVGVSESTVSGITEKLEEIGTIKNAPNRRDASNHRSTLTYQSSKGYLGKSNMERVGYEGVIAQVLSVFKKSTNKTYTKKELSEITEIPKSKVGVALSILLVTENIKVVGIEEGVLVYQNIKGNKRAVEICTEADSSYITLGSYIKMNNIKGDSKEIKAKVAEEKGHSRLFYSDKGIVKEYEVSYLQKVIGFGEEKKVEKEKGLLERIKIW